jgi:hypothetical protein
MKMAGSGSGFGFVSLRYGSADPDPYQNVNGSQNVTDPQEWCKTLTRELKRMMPRICDPVDRLEGELGSVQLYPRAQRALVHPGQYKNTILEPDSHSFLRAWFTIKTPNPKCRLYWSLIEL